MLPYHHIGVHPAHLNDSQWLSPKRCVQCKPYSGHGPSCSLLAALQAIVVAAFCGKMIESISRGSTGMGQGLERYEELSRFTATDMYHDPSSARGRQHIVSSHLHSHCLFTPTSCRNPLTMTPRRTRSQTRTVPMGTSTSQSQHHRTGLIMTLSTRKPLSAP